MKIIVFGANGPTGRILTRMALAEDHQVVAFTRRPDSFPIQHPALHVQAGDIHDRAGVTKAIVGGDAVLSTVGVPFTKAPITVYSDGATNIIAGMRTAGIKRLVCVTSSAVDPHPEPLGGFFFTHVAEPYVTKVLGRTTYDDMRRMEAIVRGSDLAWTIVRPSGLFEAAEVTPYEIALDHIGHRFTSRTDLADCLLRQATDDQYARATLAVATTAIKPNMLKLIWREAIHKPK
jgi:putative NADH-flavin reductase